MYSFPPLCLLTIHQAHTLTTIASCDWPDEYPDLLDSLLNLLSSGSPDAIHGAMQMFTDFVKSELTEDQLLPTLRQLLPVLLNILGDAEVSTLCNFCCVIDVSLDYPATFTTDTIANNCCIPTMR